MNPTLDEQIAELGREVAIREQLYPGWIRNGRLKQDVADKQLRRLRAALDTLRGLRAGNAREIASRQQATLFGREA